MCEFLKPEMERLIKSYVREIDLIDHHIGVCNKLEYETEKFRLVEKRRDVIRFRNELQNLLSLMNKE
jgi:hypothetical protein